MSGTPLWWRSKCSELGVMMPSSASSGVREPPVPAAPAVAFGARCTCASCGERSPYARIGMPGVFIHAGTSGGAARAVSNVAPASAAGSALQEQPPMQQAVAGDWLERVGSLASSSKSPCCVVVQRAAGIDGAGPMPLISTIASTSLAPSKCTSPAGCSM